MLLQELIERLERAPRPDRALDGEIATLLGWSRKVEYVKAGAKGEPVKRVFWVVPSGGNPATVPMFTNSLDAAVELVTLISPSSLWGVGFAEGLAAGIIDSGPSLQAPTPAMALCVAALKIKLAREGDV